MEEAENGEIVSPSFSKTYQLSLLLYWQIRYQISQNAFCSGILHQGLWRIPSSDIWDKYYESVCESTKAVIAHEIAIADYVSIFIDGWKKHHRFEGIRLSFCNYGTLFNRFLSMMFLDGKEHSAENLADAIKELDKEYNFLSKAIWLVSDCARVNSATSTILNIQFVPCGAHRYMICFKVFNKNPWFESIISWLSSQH